MMISPTGIRYLAPTKRSAIHPPISGVAYVNATRYELNTAPSSFAKPSPPSAAAVTTKIVSNHLAA
jgi:hypothetical protein